MSALNLNKSIFSASFIDHSESALGCDASADSSVEADPGLSTPNDSIPQQQGIDEGTKNTSFDHISAGADPHVVIDQTKYVREGLEIVLTQPLTGKGASSIDRKIEEEDASNTIKLEDLAKLVLKIINWNLRRTKLKLKLLSLKLNPPFLIRSLPAELKDLSSKFNELTKEVKGLKKQVDELKTLQWELPTEFLSLPEQVLDSASSKAGGQSVPSAG
ncbi:hypothetical protein Tco_0445934 [Tanacetum coccineum]